MFQWLATIKHFIGYWNIIFYDGFFGEEISNQVYLSADRWWWEFLGDLYPLWFKSDITPNWPTFYVDREKELKSYFELFPVDGRKILCCDYSNQILTMRRAFNDFVICVQLESVWNMLKLLETRHWNHFQW